MNIVQPAPNHQLTSHQLYIGGEWIEPAGTAMIEVISPNTELPVGAVPLAVQADLDSAAAAARRAFDASDGWGSWQPKDRGAAMRRFADAIDRRKEEFARLVSIQNGMPITVAHALEGMLPALLLRYYADLADAADIEEDRAGIFGGTATVRREPVGVVGAIVPWNVPQSLAFMKFAPALAAGCTVVAKPSPETVLDSVLLAEAAIEAQLPAGVLNIVPGGAELGAALVDHRGIDKIAFTGSTAVGRRVAEACGRLLRPVTLELGGKSAAIVLDDADLDLSRIGEQLFLATMVNNGQTCFLSTRILAPHNRYSEVVDCLKHFAETLVVGESTDPTTQVGPMVSATHRDRVESYIAQGVAEGGRIITGGVRPDRVGWFVAPTVFAGLDNSAVVSQEEIFGPVLTVIGYSDEEEAVALANDSAYGLGGTVWTSDPDRGLNIARRVRTGSFGINGYLPDPVAPIGGFKASGIGREYGPEALWHYQQLKSIYR